MNLKAFGDRMRRAREQAGLSQHDLAHMVDKTQNSISAYETGKRGMRIEDLPVIADALNVSIAYLFGADRADQEFVSTFEELTEPNQKFALEVVRLILRHQRINESQQT